MIRQFGRLAILILGFAVTSASASILRYYNPYEDGLAPGSESSISESFDIPLASWNSISGKYALTAGDFANIGGGVRGADGKYLRVYGKDCSNISPLDCDQLPGVDSTIDLLPFAGQADAYRVILSLDIVTEGDMNNDFSWLIRDLRDRAGGPPQELVARWHANELLPTCTNLDLWTGECLEYGPPIIDYSAGPYTVQTGFWLVGDTAFTQNFYSTESYGFWALDGFWGVDNMNVSVTPFSIAPQETVSEPSTLALLGLGLATFGFRRRCKAN